MLLAACGSTDTDTSGSATAPAAASADDATATTTGSPAALPTGEPETSEAPAGTVPSGEPNATTPPAITDDAEADAPAQASAMAWPDDGCSTDNSPTATESADGPAPVLEIRAESADSPLPDLAVRRINCNGGWVNLRNELPSDQPLLVWFWAPH